MEIKYLYSVTSHLWCLIIIDGFCLICSSMSPYKPPSRSILIVTFEIFLKSSQLPFFFSGSLPLLSFFSPVSFLSLLCFLSSSPCRPLSQSQAIPCLSRGGGTGSSEDKPFPFNFSETWPGVLSLSRREQIRAATETKFSKRVMKSVARQRNKMTLLLSGEFTDRVEAHNTVEVQLA